MLHYNFYQSQNNSNQLLVLLHGFISDSRTFNDDVQYFSQEANVLTIDLPGAWTRSITN